MDAASLIDKIRDMIEKQHGISDQLHKTKQQALDCKTVLTVGGYDVAGLICHNLTKLCIGRFRNLNEKFDLCQALLYENNNYLNHAVMCIRIINEWKKLLSSVVPFIEFSILLPKLCGNSLDLNTTLGILTIVERISTIFSSLSHSLNSFNIDQELIASFFSPNHEHVSMSKSLDTFVNNNKWKFAIATVSVNIFNSAFYYLDSYKLALASVAPYMAFSLYSLISNSLTRCKEIVTISKNIKELQSAMNNTVHSCLVYLNNELKQWFSNIGFLLKADNYKISTPEDIVNILYEINDQFIQIKTQFDCFENYVYNEVSNPDVALVLLGVDEKYANLFRLVYLFDYQKECIEDIAQQLSLNATEKEYLQTWKMLKNGYTSNDIMPQVQLTLKEIETLETRLKQIRHIFAS